MHSRATELIFGKNKRNLCPTSGWAAEGKRNRPNGGVTVSPLLNQQIFSFIRKPFFINRYAIRNRLYFSTFSG